MALTKSSDSKTTWAGAIAGAVVAFGGPIINLFSQAPTDALHSLSVKDLILGIAITILGKFAAGTKKE